MNNKVLDEEIVEQKEYMQKVKSIIKKGFYYIETMGCLLNENDSEKIEGMLVNMGYEKINDYSKANVAVLNTCCIRENAENRVFGKLGAMKQYKKDGLIIAICGCMPQEKHIVNKIHESYNFVDIIFGTHTLYRFPELLFNVINTNGKAENVIDIDGQIVEGLPVKRNDKYKANVTIMNGCNNFCSYCIVPYVRGRERSRNIEDIIAEIKELAINGYKEIILLGQNVNSYGKDLNDANSIFANLLYRINKIEGIEIIKFLSPHPKDFTDDVIHAIKECEKVHKVLHLPLQSGSTNVLKAMNRKYTKENYLNLVNKIRTEIPEVAFTTDIIVGFPGETEEDFQDTLDVISQVKFEQLFMFIYSRRVGTIADKMENQIPEDVKSERFTRLKKLADSIVFETGEKYIGTIQNILVDGISKNNDKMLTGRTNSGRIVNFEGKIDLIGQNVYIKIISNHGWYLKGNIAEN